MSEMKKRCFCPKCKRYSIFFCGKPLKHGICQECGYEMDFLTTKPVEWEPVLSGGPEKNI